jgi:ATP-dependent Clp protease ATP-binding subunit ClpB
LQVSDVALLKIAEAGFDPVYGARPLKRAIQQEIRKRAVAQFAERRICSKRYNPYRRTGRRTAFQQGVSFAAYNARVA